MTPFILVQLSTCSTGETPAGLPWPRCNSIATTDSVDIDIGILPVVPGDATSFNTISMISPTYHSLYSTFPIIEPIVLHYKPLLGPAHTRLRLNWTHRTLYCRHTPTRYKWYTSTFEHF